VTALAYATLPPELMGFLKTDFVDSLPAGAQGVQRFLRKCAAVDQSGFIIQRAQGRVQMVAVRINELERNDGYAQILHGSCELLDATPGRAEAICRPNLGAVGVP